MIQTLAARPASAASWWPVKCSSWASTVNCSTPNAAKPPPTPGLDLVVGVRGNAQHLAAAACWGGVASIFLPDAQSAGEWLSVRICSPATWC